MAQLINIQTLIDEARLNPCNFKIVGKGGHCLALAHPSVPDGILLLETNKGDVCGAQDGARSFRAHQRAVDFARKYDEHISAGASQVRNSAGQPFVHSDMMGYSSFRHFGEPLFLHIGNGSIFTASTARLIRRIPGQALNYQDFVDPQSPITPPKLKSLSQDIAKWLFTLHHQVSPGALVANKIDQQFQDLGANLTDRPLNSRKFRILTNEGISAIERLARKAGPDAPASDSKASLLEVVAVSGVDISLLSEIAKMTEPFLRKILPTDRVGLVHSDMHMANIIASKDYASVNGVCDWMTATVDAQSMDLAALALAKGLLPNVMREYASLEKAMNVAQPINQQAVYAYAVMWQVFNTVKALEGRDHTAARVAWGQVGESLDRLSRKNTKFGSLARRFRHKVLPPLILPPVRKQFGSRPRRAEASPA